MSDVSKQIWLGPVLGNNRSRLIQTCATLVSEGDTERFLYLAASHPLLEVLSEGIVRSSTNTGLWGELPVYLFRGFVRRILSSAIYTETRAPLTPRTPIDREELPLKRSLISQILKQLKQDGRLRALGPLAGREGCVNTVVSLIGEIQRAGKTPADLNTIVTARAEEYGPEDRAPDTKAILQLDFDREIALVYETYARLLEEHELTDDDANGLRALAILQGVVGDRSVLLPWLEEVELLVLDGFFDFTPVQGEMLRLLIPRFPRVIVNLNGDTQNPDIFKPFNETIERLRAIGDFELIHDTEAALPVGALQPLRHRLFNPSIVASTDEDSSEAGQQSVIRYLECTDRETEIRAIAKETKRLLLQDRYRLSDISCGR